MIFFWPRSRGGLENFTLIAGMGHFISEPKFKIPTPPPPLLIRDKSLVKAQQYFVTSSCMFLDEKTMLEIGLILA